MIERQDNVIVIVRSSPMLSMRSVYTSHHWVDLLLSVSSRLSEAKYRMSCYTTIKDEAVVIVPH